MRLFRKQKSKNEVKVDLTKKKTEVSVGHIARPKLFKKLPIPPINLTKKQKLVAFVVILLVAATSFYLYSINNRNKLSPSSTEAIEANRLNKEGNVTGALVHARKALAHAPDDLDTIQAVIILIENDNPEEAKKLYQHSLEIFKKQDNPDMDGKPVLTYWAAAGLAEKSGYVDQAKKYFQKVIDASDESNSEHQILARKAQVALERLK